MGRYFAFVVIGLMYAAAVAYVYDQEWRLSAYWALAGSLNLVVIL